MPKKKPSDRLPIRTSFRTKIPGLEVRDDRNGQRYTLSRVNRDSVVLVDVDDNELEVDNDEFEDKYTLD